MRAGISDLDKEEGVRQPLQGDVLMQPTGEFVRVKPQLSTWTWALEDVRSIGRTEREVERSGTLEVFILERGTGSTVGFCDHVEGFGTYVGRFQDVCGCSASHQGKGRRTSVVRSPVVQTGRDRGRRPITRTRTKEILRVAG